MSTQKTQPTEQNIEAFIASVGDPQKQQDSTTLVALMEEVTGEPAKLWGSSIIGFGSYHYKYESGHEGDWAITGFSPRKQNLTIYIIDGFEKYEGLMSKLGKYKTGKSCLYVKSLEDIDLDILNN